MDDVLDYIDNANLNLNQLVEADLLTGKENHMGLNWKCAKNRQVAGLG